MNCDWALVCLQQVVFCPVTLQQHSGFERFMMAQTWEDDVAKKNFRPTHLAADVSQYLVIVTII